MCFVNEYLGNEQKMEEIRELDSLTGSSNAMFTSSKVILTDNFPVAIGSGAAGCVDLVNGRRC